MIGGNLLPTYRQPKAIQPLRKPLGLSMMNQLPPGAANTTDTRRALPTA
jgi:hypothetical protein